MNSSVAINKLISSAICMQSSCSLCFVLVTSQSSATAPLCAWLLVSITNFGLVSLWHSSCAVQCSQKQRHNVLTHLLWTLKSFTCARRKQKRNINYKTKIQTEKSLESLKGNKKNMLKRNTYI